MTTAEIARAIDHTILKAEATEAEVRKVVAEAIEHHFAAVCVNGRWARLVSGLLREAGAGHPAGGVPVLACSCAGFPLGATASAIKGVEAAACVNDGAREIDMVIDIASLLQGDLDYARSDVAEVVRAARAVSRQAVVKVILETALLNEEQIALGCRAAGEGGADFVKTSTGLHPRGGATLESVKLLVKHGKQQYGMKVKAAGGIRDRATAEAMLAAGADRLGCSASVAIVRAAR